MCFDIHNIFASVEFVAKINVSDDFTKKLDFSATIEISPISIYFHSFFYISVKTVKEKKRKFVILDHGNH